MATPSSSPLTPLELAGEIASHLPLIKINEELFYLHPYSHYYRQASNDFLEKFILDFITKPENEDNLKYISKRYIKETLYFLSHMNYPLCEPAEYSGWLGFRNGVVNIFSREFIGYTPENLQRYPPITYALDVCYYPNYNIYSSGSATPVTDKFFSRIAGNNYFLLNRLWEMLGYILTPDINAKVFFVLQGVPNSGKSVLGRFVEQFFPREKVSSLDINRLGGQFLPKELVQSCLNSSMDLPDGQLSSNAIAMIKMMTGNDRITQEAKYKNPSFVYSHCKLLFSTNHSLSLKKYDPAFLDRIICIPFKTTIPKTDADRNLYYNLCTEKEAVVNKALSYYWCLQNRNYEFSGGPIFPEIEYRLEPNEVIREFVEECCILNDEGKTYTHELYEAYKKFCIKKGFRSVPEQGFGQRLSKVCDGKIEHSKWRTGGNPENGWLRITLIKYKEHSVKHMTI